MITGGIKGVPLYGCVASGYHVRLYAIPAFILVLPYHGHGLYRGANQKLTDIAPMVPGCFKALGTSRMDSYAHLRLSTMVYIGYLIDHLAWNRLLGAAHNYSTLRSRDNLLAGGSTLVRPISEVRESVALEKTHCRGRE